MMNTTTLDTQNEAAVLAFQRYLEGARSDQYVELEDATLGGAIRRIYYLHTFEGRLLFTRFDFVRGGSGWMLSALSFGSSWTSVATQNFPGWVLS